jgi:hypothetical protein
MIKLPILRAVPGGRHRSFVVYRGPSAFDDKPVVAIVSGAGGATRNQKTGPMAQLWILRADVAPHEAQKTGEDQSVCGDCSLRPLVAREQGLPKCYVVTYQSANSTWRAHRDEPEDLAGCAAFLRQAGASLRLGAYGDPAALPERVVRTLAFASSGFTGYTHAWRNTRAMRDLLMASVESEGQKQEAQALGWRTFRVRRPEDRVLSDEIICPAANESEAKRSDGLDVQCYTCRLCDGRVAQDARKNITIMAHGWGVKTKTEVA